MRLSHAHRFQAKNEIFIKGSSIPTAKESLEAFTLFFVGRITRTPVLGSIPICEVFGQEFHVSGVGYNNTHDEIVAADNHSQLIPQFRDMQLLNIIKKLATI